METCAQRGCPGVQGGACHCGRCHQTFTGVTAFDEHQRLTGVGVACLDPEATRDGAGRGRFAVWRVLAGGQPVWGRALRPGETTAGRYQRGREPQTA